MYNERTFAQNESLSDLDLAVFAGPNGLMTLLEFLSDNPEASEELIEVIKRLHVPLYEQSRRYLARAVREGVFEPNTKAGFHSQRDMQAVIAWAATQSD